MHTAGPNVDLCQLTRQPIARFLARRHSLKRRKPLHSKSFRLEPEAGFEPAAYALRVRCSTPELPRRQCGRIPSPSSNGLMGVRSRTTERRYRLLNGGGVGFPAARTSLHVVQLRGQTGQPDRAMQKSASRSTASSAKYLPHDGGRQSLRSSSRLSQVPQGRQST